MIRGTTHKLVITVRNKATGELIDCTRCNGILIGVYQEGGKVLQKYSKVSKTGFDTIDQTDAVNGVLSVIVHADKLLEGIRDKMVKLEGIFSFDESGYPNNLRINGDTGIIIREVETSIFEGVSPI